MLNVKVITQTRTLYEGIATNVSVPTTQGDITIMPNHMNIVTLITMGILRIKHESETRDILVDKGLVKIENNSILVLSDEAILSKEIVISEINAAIENAKHQKAMPLSSSELIQLEKQLKFDLFKKQFIEEH